MVQVGNSTELLVGEPKAIHRVVSISLAEHADDKGKETIQKVTTLNGQEVPIAKLDQFARRSASDRFYDLIVVILTEGHTLDAAHTCLRPGV